MSRIRAALLAATAAAAFAAPSFADDSAGIEPGYMRVDYDQSRVVHLDRPAKHVVVGNPLIADALMLSDTLVYVQGRAFGNTNVIAVDADGREVLNTLVTVGAPNIAQVTLYRGPKGQQNVACSPLCERTLTQGDAEFEPMKKNADDKIEVSAKSADLASEKR